MLIRTKFLGPTNHRGSRIVVEPVDPRRGYRFTFPYDHSARYPHYVAATQWWQRMKSEYKHGDEYIIGHADSHSRGEYFIISAPI